jgi:hypothetical protein
MERRALRRAIGLNHLPLLQIRGKGLRSNAGRNDRPVNEREAHRGGFHDALPGKSCRPTGTIRANAASHETLAKPAPAPLAVPIRGGRIGCARREYVPLSWSLCLRISGTGYGFPRK